MIHILTFKCGNKYDYRSVNMLYRSILFHYESPFQFHCMTDNPDNLDKDIIVHPMQDPFRYDFNSISMMKAGFAGIEGDIVMMDIDIEVVSDPSLVFDHPIRDNEIGMIHKWWQYPYQKGSFICGMLYKYRANQLDQFYQRFIQKPDYYTDHYTKVNGDEHKLQRKHVHVHGEQDYVLECAGIYNFHIHLFPSFVAENLQPEIEFNNGTWPMGERLRKYLYYKSLPEKIDQPLIFKHYTGCYDQYVDKRYRFYQ